MVPLWFPFPILIDYHTASPVSCPPEYICPLLCPLRIIFVSCHVASLHLGLFFVSGFLPTPCRFGCLYPRSVSCITFCPLLDERFLHSELCTSTWLSLLLLGPLIEHLRVVIGSPMSRSLNVKTGILLSWQQKAITRVTMCLLV